MKYPFICFLALSFCLFNSALLSQADQELRFGNHYKIGLHGSAIFHPSSVGGSGGVLIESCKRFGFRTGLLFQNSPIRPFSLAHYELKVQNPFVPVPVTEKSIVGYYHIHRVQYFNIPVQMTYQIHPRLNILAGAEVLAMHLASGLYQDYDANQPDPDPYMGQKLSGKNRIQPLDVSAVLGVEFRLIDRLYLHASIHNGFIPHHPKEARKFHHMDPISPQTYNRNVQIGLVYFPWMIGKIID